MFMFSLGVLFRWWSRTPLGSYTAQDNMVIVWIYRTVDQLLHGTEECIVAFWGLVTFYDSVLRLTRRIHHIKDVSGYVLGSRLPFFLFRKFRVRFLILRWTFFLLYFGVLGLNLSTREGCAVSFCGGNWLHLGSEHGYRSGSYFYFATYDQKKKGFKIEHVRCLSRCQF